MNVRETPINSMEQELKRATAATSRRTKRRHVCSFEVLEDRLALSAATASNFDESSLLTNESLLASAKAHSVVGPVSSSADGPQQIKSDVDGSVGPAEVFTSFFPDGIRHQEDKPKPKPDEDDNEDDPAEPPAEVSSAFLAGSPPGSLRESMSFDDIKQLQSPTCAFASALSAVARTNFDLASGIRVLQQSGSNTTYSVRLYRPDDASKPTGSYHAVWITVGFDGTISNNDLQSTQTGEYWPTLYQRAYVKEIGGDGSGSVSQALRILTGKSTTFFEPGTDPRGDAFRVLYPLSYGHATVAGTKPDGPVIIPGTPLIHNHAYTVVGIEIPNSGVSGTTYVTLRNPWGRDTSYDYYDTNRNGTYSTAELLAMEYGLDGNDDGLIRITWAQFSSAFTFVVYGDGTGPAINTPLNTFPPRFNNYNQGPFTIYEGEQLYVNAAATDPQGSGVRYSLKEGSHGYINPTSGQYLWEPLSGTAGTHYVTVIAEVTQYETSTLTFQVNVLSSKPRIGTFFVNRPAITTSGSDLITLVARDVTTDIGHIDRVEFFRDTNHNGVLDDIDGGSNNDLELGYDYSASDGYTWSGFLSNLTVGTETLFARALRFSTSDSFYSTPKKLTLQVGSAPVTPVMVSKIGATIDVDPASTGPQDGSWVRYDASGNYAAFYYDETATQGYMRRYNSGGSVIGATVALSQVRGAINDVAMMPDGHFIVVWSQSGIRAKEFNANGTQYSTTTTLVSATGGANAPASVAICGYGDYAVVVPVGSYLSENVVYFRYLNEALASTKTLNAGSTASAVDIAMDARGASIVAWVDINSRRPEAQRMTSAGTLLGGVMDLDVRSEWTYIGSAAISVAMEESGRFVFAWVGENGPSRNDIFARRYFADATPADAQEFIVNISAAKDQVSPQVDFRAGRIVVKWNSWLNGVPGYDVHGQAYSWENTFSPLGGNFLVQNSDSSQRFYTGTLAIDYQGVTFTIGYLGAPGSSGGAYYQRFTGLNVAPLGLALREPDPTAGAVMSIPEGLPLNTQIGVLQPGGNLLDTTFGGSGIVAKAIGTTSNVANELAIQSDGKIVVVGQTAVGSNINFGVLRYNSDGTLDSTFGVGGVVTTDFGGGGDFATAIAIQSDGRIVVAGWTRGSSDQIAVARYNVNGSPDNTFDGDGKLTVPLGGSCKINDVAIQPDGKIVVVGLSRSVSSAPMDCAVVRFNSNGSLDNTFDGDGKLILPLGSSDDSLESIALQPDGRMVAAGTFWNTSNFPEFALVRLNANGSLDTTFDGDGKRTLLIGSRSEAFGVVLQPDGKIALAGVSNTQGGKFSFAMVRFNSDGSLDSTFDEDGTKELIVSSGATVYCTGLTLLQDGKFAIVGYSTTAGVGRNMIVVRLEPNGAVDNSFGVSGISTIGVGSSGDSLNAVALQSDGKIVAAGATSNDGAFAVLRLNNVLPTMTYQFVSGEGSTDNGLFKIVNGQLRTNAAIDFETKPRLSIRVRATPSSGVAYEQVFTLNVRDTFAGDDKVTSNFGILEPTSERGYAMATQADGKIVVVGASISGSASSNTSEFAVARYNADGSLDRTFSDDGVALDRAPGATKEVARSVAIQPDGKIVAAGSVLIGSTYRFRVRRYNADGSPDTTFMGAGVTSGTGSVGDGGVGLALQPDGKILVTGSSTINNRVQFVVLRFNSDGGIDETFGGGAGNVHTSFGSGINDYARSLALQPDGKIVVAGVTIAGAAEDIALVRYNSDGSLDLTFDGDGRVSTPIGTGNDGGNSVALQPDGKIVVAGYSMVGSTLDFALVRYNTNGSLDLAFDGDGKVTTPVGTSTDIGRSVAVQADGKIVVAGQSLSGSANMNFALVRYNVNGSLDTSLDGDGKVTIDFDVGGLDVCYSVQILGDGRAFLAGESEADTNNFALTSVNLDGAPTATLSSSTNIVTGQKVTVSINSFDPSLIDQAAGVIYKIDWDGNGTTDETIHSATGAQLSHTFTAPGNYTIKMTATDQDGMVSPVVTKSIIVANAAEVEPNDTSATAMLLPVQTLTGSIGNGVKGAQDVDYYRFTLAANSYAVFAGFNARGFNAANGKTLTLFDAQGNNVTDSLSDAGGFANAPGGTFTIRISGPIGSYDLSFAVFQSHVNRLPTFTGNPNIGVSWVSEAGSGVAAHDLYVSVDGGAFSLWQFGAASGEANYPGAVGHTYRFYSVAVDSVGQRLTNPGLPQATVTVRAFDVKSPSNLAAVASSLSHSDESYSNFIRSAYLKYLGRPADSAGLQSWLSVMRTGAVSDEQLESYFVGSAEYIAAHGGSGAEWVRGMYIDLLGRAPSQSEVDDWVARLAAGLSPVAVAYGFAASVERESLRVQQNYQTYLGRSPSPSEVNFWVDQFVNHGMTTETMAAGFVGSAEFWNNPYKGAGTNSVWISSAYQAILNRLPGEAEIANGSAALQLPSNLGSIAVQITHSDESFSKFITNAYDKYLGRPADSAGLQSWLNLMRAGVVTDEQLESSFVGSPEYIAAHGGSGDAWVRGMYNDLLGRSPSQVEVEGWVASLAGGVSPVTVAYGFAASAEREGLRVQQNYQTYLGRIAAPSEISFWVEQFISHGMTTETMAAGFIASPEYYLNGKKGAGSAVEWLDSIFSDVHHRSITESELLALISALS